MAGMCTGGFACGISFFISSLFLKFEEKRKYSVLIDLTHQIGQAAIFGFVHVGVGPAGQVGHNGSVI